MGGEQQSGPIATRWRTTTTEEELRERDLPMAFWRGILAIEDDGPNRGRFPFRGRCFSVGTAESGR